MVDFHIYSAQSIQHIARNKLLPALISQGLLVNGKQDFAMESSHFSFFEYWHDQIMINTPGILSKKQKQKKKQKKKQKNLSAVFLTK